MVNIVQFEGLGYVRVTNTGHYSVYDVISLDGQSRPSNVWKKLLNLYPELLEKYDTFKFSGKGQRETPVANRENILYIIGLLPGAVGRAYREDAARVFCQYLDASPELAGSVIDRATPEDLEQIELRLKSKKIRVTFTTVLQNHGVVEGWQFGACTNAMYRPLLGGSCKEIKQERGLSNRANLRDNLQTEELIDIMFAERLAKRKIEANNLSGYKPCFNACQSAARLTKQALDG